MGLFSSRRWGRSANIGTDVDDEIRFHFQERIEALVADGHSREAATAIAHEEFGDPEAVRHTLTAIDTRIAGRRRRVAWLEFIRQDSQYACRSLAATPGFTLLVVATLALGIGANSAIFSLVDHLFFRPPAGVRDANDLTRLYRRVDVGGPAGGVSMAVTPSTHYPGVHDIEAALPAGANLTAYTDRRAQIGRGETPPTIHAAWVGPRYFSVLGVGAPSLGRYPTEDESRVDHPAALAVISFAQWRDRFGGEAGAIGRTLELSRTTYTIIGVAPPGFAGVDVDAVDVWLTLGSLPFSFEPPWYQQRGASFLRVIVRGGSWSRDQIASAATAAYRAGAPSRESTYAVLAGPLLEARGPGTPSSEVTISTKVVGVALLVLLIACANAANLLLARSMQRRREIAVRLALGVSRARLASLFVVESLVLSLAAAAVSLLIAAWGGAAMRRTLMPDVNWASAPLDLRVAAFAFAIAMVTALATGLPSALRAGREGLTAALKTDARAGGLQRSRLRTGLLVMQVALSFALLVGAVAFVRSLLTAEGIRTGYDTERLMVIKLRFDSGGYERNRAAALLREIVDRMRARPGVADAALSGMQPLSGYASNSLFRPDGSEVPHAGELQPSFLYVSPGFFRTSGIALVKGRDFEVSDSALAQVMIVNRSMAARLWPGQDALAQCLRVGKGDQPCLPVVGVADDTHRNGLINKAGSLAPMYFRPITSGPAEFGTPSVAIVRTANEVTARELAGNVLTDLRAMLPAGVYASVTPMRDTFAGELRPLSLGTTMFTAFGLLALVVASIGTYTTTSYSVSQRTREMAIRIALGSPSSRLLRLVVRDGLMPVLAGIGIGIGLAFAFGRLIEALLYETSPADPWVLAIAVCTMTVIAAIGCLVPASRAARVDPIAALKME
jgi:predicted permease